MASLDRIVNRIKDRKYNIDNFSKLIKIEMNKSCLRDFDVLCKLGQGAFSQVFKVKRKADNKQYALKKVKIRTLKDKQRQNALNQIRIMASYDDQFIIGYKQAFYDQNSQTLCIVMQHAAQGDLLKRIQNHIKNHTKFPQLQIWKAIVHITKGLKLLHEKKILHRDLKSANVFITNDGIYKLGDLNVSKVLKKQLADTQTGTPYYASPQVWKDKPYGPKSDIWSLGCVIYEMAALKPPFSVRGSDLAGLYRKICSGRFQKIPQIYSKDLTNIINLLLQLDDRKRPSTQQLLNNSIIADKLIINIKQQQQYNTNKDQLLKTIKYNYNNLKQLKNILPKSHYQNQQQPTKTKQNTNQIQSINNNNYYNSINKQLQINYYNKLINKDSIQSNQSKSQEKPITILQDQKQQLNRNRNRLQSACQPKQPLHGSPKIQVHRKDPYLLNKQPNNQKNIPLPPLPKLPPTSQHNNNAQPNINYRLPPRPTTQKSNSITEKVNQSHEQNRNSQRKQSERLSTNIDKPKQNEQKNNVKQLPRSNSQHRVIYPSWWG